MRYTQSLAILFLLLVLNSISYGQEQTNSNNSKPATVQQPARAKAPTPLPADLASFFSGEWKGVGAFANGKEIKADVKFSPELDNQWLLYSHSDIAPNKYKAIGMWGFERTSEKFVMILQDNFGGARQFQSDGYSNGKITFANNVTTSAASYSERFIFERQTDSSFKMSYEVSRDGNIWRMVDYLVFTRK